jgi:abnormal spindle-like microcephaly-associated protein
VAKTLSHLNYTLEAVQDPLSEYDYTISNLAVDMRDGVRLARVVEVLLHSKRRTSLAPGQNADEDWPLSLHLQYPVTSRAQKLHNVSLALSALDKADANPQCIQAKDIVDGHREKTVGVLWSVLTQRGLGLLLDWDTVIRETRRLERGAFSGLSDEDVRMDVGFSAQDHVELLKNWARCIGYKHGLTVTNLTTSFADGKVFEAIVQEYEQYLPSYAKDDKEASLATKLRGIGCNSYFGEKPGISDVKSHG